MMFTKRTHGLLTFMAMTIFSFGSRGAVFHPENVEELIEEILFANSNQEDDIIDLDGKTYDLTKVYIQADYDGTCLPTIKPDYTFLNSVPHTLTIKNGTIQRSILNAPGLRCRHFAVDVGASLYLENMYLKNGFVDGSSTPGDVGGSIYNLGFLSTNGVSFFFNRADSGGAIYNDVDATLSVSSSTFFRNTATVDNGGAIDNFGIIDQIYNSTFNKNNANGASGNGGAIAIEDLSTVYSMSNNTIADNSAAMQGGGIWVFGTPAGLNRILVVSGPFFFISNIVAENNLIQTPIDNGLDVYDPDNVMSTPGYNLIGTVSLIPEHGITNGVNFNKVGTNDSPLDPGLDVLKDNGGWVWTMALLDTSLAINMGDNPLGLEFDARSHGYLREREGQTDIGAFEHQECELDSDSDGSCDDADNCPCVYNPGQEDTNGNGVGDACDPCQPCPVPCPDPCPPPVDNPCVIEPEPCPHDGHHRDEDHHHGDCRDRDRHDGDNCHRDRHDRERDERDHHDGDRHDHDHCDGEHHDNGEHHEDHSYCDCPKNDDSL